jgi:hypothetical protein
MPILAYFVLAGAFLLGLLFAADAYLPATTPAIASSNFQGLPAKYTAANGPLITSSAPEPDMHSPAVTAAQPNLAPVKQPNLAPVNVPSDTTGQSPRAKRRAVVYKRPAYDRYDHRRDNYNSYGWSWPNDNRRWAARNGSWGSWNNYR